MSYKQPPLQRGINPLKMNWLWRLIGEATHVSIDDIAAALANAGMEVSRQRMQGWYKAEHEEGYFPLTIAELEQNLRVLAAAHASPSPAEPQDAAS
ncbi:hypothetical protein [Dyella acidiphila]|uniref:Helix-turn-helix domain-containing protein n=1 Tax=Dyella acidiphila TaxID=2775866 RepID=A0ABR9GAR9_9GAMM|nr:hypothetical protein [Dyella acidiphila]MBE1161119.1 hypothetical protein [Dyella acidiphila]